MVKNEVDIIETFIRYHISIFDGMLILDNGSSDGTTEIINNLINEGLPIFLLFDDNPSYDQSHITTKILYAAIRQFNPNYVLPLDVDEFLITKRTASIRSILEKQLNQNNLFFLSWTTYVPTKKDNVRELNPLKRIIYRRKIQYNYDKKILIPAKIALKRNITVRQGNHDIDGFRVKNIKRVQLRNLSLAHIPIRSAGQAKSKYLVGWLANLARDKQVLFDWCYYYNILKGGGELTDNDLKKLALHYGVPNKRISMTIVKDPIRLSDKSKFELKYTKHDDAQYFKNVLNYAETLARKYSNLLKSISSKSIESAINNSYNDQVILQIIKNYMKVDGWLDAREAVALYRLVQSRKGDNVTVCEIGSWLGKSSYVLARALDKYKNGRLFCVDPFDASGDCASRKIYRSARRKIQTSLIEKFKENMRELGVLNKIKILRDYSHKAIKRFNRPIDVLFIDGNHDLKSVLCDYRDWSRLIKKGGFIVFHDVGAAHTTGPKEVVELEIVRNPGWTDRCLIDKLYIAKKAK